MNDQAKQALIRAQESLNKWKQSFGAWEVDSTLQVSEEDQTRVFDELVHRLEGNYPFHHPIYAGQMLKPPHPLTWAAYATAMMINPNNHALDGGPPSSEMEKEVVADLAKFYGYGDRYLGHLTASGTIANLEALWIARECNPAKKIAFSSNSHYTHERMCGVLGVEGVKIPLNDDGQFELDGVDAETIGTIVVTLGTTGLGEVEPLDQIIPWAREHNIRIHIDSAYGGFFRTLKDSNLIDGTQWKLMQEADSIVVDPHKHGMQPYGCGCVLFKDPAVGTHYKHDSPYTYFTSDDLHLGEISLECSRAGAAAVALWTTIQLFPLEEHKGFGPIMAQCRKAALKAFELFQKSTKFEPYQKPELDIIAYFPKGSGIQKLSDISKAAQQVFDKGMENRSFYLSLFKVPASQFLKKHPHFEADEESVTILRSVLMRPEHESFIPELIDRLESAI